MMTQHLSALDVSETHKSERCVVRFVKCQGKCCLLLPYFSLMFIQTFCTKHQINLECTFNAEHFSSAEHCCFLDLIVLNDPIVMGIKTYLKDQNEQVAKSPAANLSSESHNPPLVQQQQREDEMRSASAHFSPKAE